MSDISASDGRSVNSDKHYYLDPPTDPVSRASTYHGLHCDSSTAPGEQRGSFQQA